MPSGKYSVIVFDLGNVLLPFDYAPMLEKLEKVKVGLGTSFAGYYKDNYMLHRKFERGDIAESEFLKAMLESCSNLIDANTFCRYYSEIFTENIEVTALLPVLKKHYQLVLLSNTNNIHREFGYKHYEFLKYFDKMILSHEAGAVKPEPEIYKTVERFTGCAPEKHIFIDDVAEYAEGARKVGWDAIQFTGYENLVSELQERGIL